MERKNCSALYLIEFLDAEKSSIHFEVEGYLSIEGAKDDIDNQIRSLMKREELEEAHVLLTITISDAEGEMLDCDEAEVRFENDNVHFIF